MTILEQDEVTGYWTRIKGNPELQLRAHEPWDCMGRLCDIHNRRGEEPWSTWPINWRDDRGIMEMLCPHGLGHPTPAQIAFMRSEIYRGTDRATHGCDGCCAGSLDQLSETAS